MDSKSHDSDQLVTALMNSVEALTKRLDKHEEALKKCTEATVSSTAAAKQLDATVNNSNKIFNQVAQGVQDLYEKVKQLEIFAKLMGNFANLGPLFGGMGGSKPKP